MKPVSGRWHRRRRRQVACWWRRIDESRRLAILLAGGHLSNQATSFFFGWQASGLSAPAAFRGRKMPMALFCAKCRAVGKAAFYWRLRPLGKRAPSSLSPVFDDYSRTQSTNKGDQHRLIVMTRRRLRAHGREPSCTSARAPSRRTPPSSPAPASNLRRQILGELQGSHLRRRRRAGNFGNRRRRSAARGDVTLFRARAMSPTKRGPYLLRSVAVLEA